MSVLRVGAPPVWLRRHLVSPVQRPTGNKSEHTKQQQQEQQQPQQPQQQRPQQQQQQQQPFQLSSYRTAWGKSSAYIRFLLNRFQPWSSDHRLALASWFAIGTTWWIVAATTTFLSLVIWMIPSDSFQESVAHRVSNYVTQYSGARVSFGRAIQPTWKSLRFEDVRIVRNEQTCGVRDSMELDLHIDRLDVRVSLLWLLEGKGLIESCLMAGVRGTVDMRKCWNVYDLHGNLIQWKDYTPPPVRDRPRSEWFRGSMHLDRCVVEDVEVWLLQPQPERPLKVIVHHLNSKRLRRQWLLYDLLTSSIDGSLDHRLFSFRPPMDADRDRMHEQTSFHMDGLNLDIVNAGASAGPLSWITQGRVDVDAVLYFPKHAPETTVGVENPGYVDFKVNMNLTQLTASVSLGDANLSYVNAALVQPIVVYLNTNYVSIPMSTSFSVPLSNFDGAWTMYDAGVTDALSEGVAVELAKKVEEQKTPKNVMWLIVKGIDGIIRALRHSSYVFWYSYAFYA